jgi:hypothetical protein
MRRPVTLLVALALVGFAGCSGGGKKSASETTATTMPNPFATPGASSASADSSGQPRGGLEIGQCFDADSFRAGAPIDPAQTRLMPCAGPHQHEVYDVGVYPAAPRAPYPGDATIGSYTDDRCIAAFVVFVGIEYQTSTLDFATVHPDGASWGRGDRQVACVLHDADFLLLTGSMKDARR